MTDYLGKTSNTHQHSSITVNQMDQVNQTLCTYFLIQNLDGSQHKINHYYFWFSCFVLTEFGVQEKAIHLRGAQTQNNGHQMF